MIASWHFKCATANLALFQSDVLNKLISVQLYMQTHSLTATCTIISSLEIVVLYLGIDVWGFKFASRLSLGLHFLFFWFLGCRFVFVICAPWTSDMIFVFLRISHAGVSHSYNNMQRWCLNFLVTSVVIQHRTVE